MKKRNTYMAAAALCIINCALCITSCSIDEATVEGDRIPMTLTATVGQPTRSTADNSQWTGTETVAIKTTQAGDTEETVKKYIVDASGAMTIATGVEPFYFKSSSERKSVTAWYPYSETEPTTWEVETDQSSDENYAKSDLLKAASITARPSETNTLTFTHQTAKITLNVKQVGATTPDIASINIGGITPHKATTSDATTYDVLIQPSTIKNGTTLFSIITTDGNVFLYTLDGDLTLEAGKQYIFNITVSSQELSVTTANIISWTEGGSGSGTATIE